jgi:hypothetical protein
MLLICATWHGTVPPHVPRPTHHDPLVHSTRLLDLPDISKSNTDGPIERANFIFLTASHHSPCFIQVSKHPLLSAAKPFFFNYFPKEADSFVQAAEAIGTHIQGVSSYSHHVLAHDCRANEICAVCRHGTLHFDIAEERNQGRQNENCGPESQAQRVGHKREIDCTTVVRRIQM